MLTNLNRRTKLIGLSILAALLLTIWWKWEPYQSHYLSGLRTLGDQTTQNFFGSPKEGRGDEWATYIPFLKQAYLEHFPQQSSLPPYKEQFNWFIGLPHADATLFFLPNQLTYWFLSGGHALSFQAFYYYLLLIGSVVWLLRNLGARNEVCWTAAVMLAFTQLYQVWWTSNFPSLGASILPFAILTGRLRPPYKGLLMFWAVGHLLFGEIYPPFYVSITLALLPLVLALRPDLLRLRGLVVVGVGALAALACFVYMKADYIQAMSHTSYPGQRISMGKGSNIHALLALVFPTMPSGSVPGGPDPVYELSVAGTIFPLIFLALVPQINWDRKARLATLVALAVTLFLCIYAVVGFPAWLSKATLLSYVPGQRTHLGLSLIALVYSAVMISDNWERMRILPIVVVLAGAAALAYLLGTDASVRSQFLGFRYYPYVALALVSCAYIVARLLRISAPVQRMAVPALLVGMSVIHVITFGAFNPVMRAGSILQPVDTQITRDWKALYEMNNRQPFAVEGNYGHLLRGEGLPALEAIHMVNVDSRIYADIFPDTTADWRQNQFNRFVGIAFSNIAETAAGATLVFPLRAHGVSLSHDVTQETPSGNFATALAAAPNIKLAKAWNGQYLLLWSGALNQPYPPHSLFSIALPCPVVDSWLNRYPTSLAIAGPARPGLQGVVGQLTVTAASEASALACASKMQLRIAIN